MKSFFRFFIATALLSWLLPTFEAKDVLSIALFSAALSISYGVLYPALKLITLPINVVTLGLFSSLLSLALLWFSTYVVPGFSITAMTVMGVPLNYFWSLVLASTLLSLTTRLVGVVIR